MAYIKIENGIIVEKLVKNPAPNTDDYINAPDDVTCGQVQQQDGSFAFPPAPTPSIMEQIFALEIQQTLRRIREAAPDDAGGTADGRAWMKDINDQIAALRAQLD